MSADLMKKTFFMKRNILFVPYLMSSNVCSIDNAILNGVVFF